MKIQKVSKVSESSLTGRAQISAVSLVSRLLIFFVLVGLVASSFYVASSASGISENNSAASAGYLSGAGGSFLKSSSALPASTLFMLPPQAAPETITTYASNCTTPKTVFQVGDIVCAKTSGVPAFPTRRLNWSTTDSSVVRSTPLTTDPQTDSFQITATSVVGGNTIDNRGTWRLTIRNPFFFFTEASATFTVVDPANATADLSVAPILTPSAAQAGAQVVFELQVTNNGPDESANVKLTDVVPANTTFVSFQQLSGPIFTCSNPDAGSTGSSICTISSLNQNDPAIFIATYLVNNGVSAGTEITNTASIGGLNANNPTGTADQNPRNDSASSTTTVTTTPCVITCPENITVSADSGQSGAIVTFATPTTTGDCGQASVDENGNPVPPYSTSPASGSFFPVGTTTVATFGSNGGGCTFLVTVDNPGGLSISLSGPNPSAVECGDDFNDPGASAVNGTGQSVPVVSTLPQGFDPSGPAVGSYTITYTATEGQNSVSTTRTVNVSDTNAPSITVSGANPYRIQQGSCSAFVDPGVSANDGCAGSTPVTSVISGPGGATSVNPNTPGTYTVTYTATDGTHSATATRNVLVGNFPEDEVDQPASANQPPTITLNCPTGVSDCTQTSIECGDSFTDLGATAAVCGSSVPVTATGTVDRHTPGVYTIHYSATANGLTTTATRTVTVEADNTAPTITVTGANPMTVECHTSFTDPGAVAHDACAGDFAATATGSVNVNTVGAYVITYNATDPSGHVATAVTRTVNVVDTTAPTVTAPANVTVNTGSGAASCSAVVSNATLGTGSANDACQGSLSPTRSGVPSGNVFPVGTTTVTYSATDAHGNTGTATQTVTVVDNTAPTITLNGGNPITVECHTSFTDPGATAHDNCSADFAATVSGSVNVNVVGSYTLTYNATDAAGNHATAITRTVNVVDTTAPTISVTTQTLSMWPPNHKYSTFQVTNFVTAVNDSCNTSLGISSVVIEKVTSDETENGNGDGNTSNDIVIAANCKSVQLRSERDGGGNGRVYTITFKVTDASGNVGRATSKVVVAHNPGETAVDSGVHYTVNGTCP